MAMGGKERTIDGFKGLFEGAGLKLVEVWRVPGVPGACVEARLKIWYIFIRSIRQHASIKRKRTIEKPLFHFLKRQVTPVILSLHLLFSAKLPLIFRRA
jgi:hypothetical protein